MAHRYRLYGILILLVLDAALLAATHYGVSDATLEGLRPVLETALATVLAILSPALADAVVIERRRRDPSIPALPDDVTPNVIPQRAAIRATRPPPGTLTTLCLALLASGCGGPPREARVALEQTAGGVAIVDEALAVAVRSKGEEARAQIRLEVNAGTIVGDTPDALVAASLERFEALMQPTTVARTVLQTVDRSLRAVEAGLDAWAAGTDEGASFFAAAACAVVSLAELVAALEAAGVDVPELLTDGVRLVSTFAVGACPGER